MDIRKLLTYVDHTNLSVSATWDDIRQICDDGVKYGCASVCIPACYVGEAHAYNTDLNVCTVIGFPNGYTTTAAKCFEAEDAVRAGAGEIDMVINVGWLKARRCAELREEINAVKAACNGALLKVIVETCLLTQEDKIEICGIVSDTAADFIKTSTGFSTGGATVEDVRLMRKYTAGHIGVKAAGGISSLEDAAAMIEAGATRLGTSRIVKIVKQQELL